MLTRQIYKKQKIVPDMHNISRISDSPISTSYSIRYEINVVNDWFQHVNPYYAIASISEIMRSNQEHQFTVN